MVSRRPLLSWTTFRSPCHTPACEAGGIHRHLAAGPRSWPAEASHPILSRLCGSRSGYAITNACCPITLGEQANMHAATQCMFLVPLPIRAPSPLPDNFPASLPHPHFKMGGIRRHLAAGPSSWPTATTPFLVGRLRWNRPGCAGRASWLVKPAAAC